MRSAKKVLTIPSLSERIRALEEETNDALDRLAEQTRPSSVPAGVVRRMWEAKANNNVFHAYLAAVKETGL